MSNDYFGSTSSADDTCFGSVHDMPVISGAMRQYFSGKNGAELWKRGEQAKQAAANRLGEVDLILYGVAASCQGLSLQEVNELIDSIDSEGLSPKGRDFLWTLRNAPVNKSSGFLDGLLKCATAEMAEDEGFGRSKKRIYN